VETILLSAQRRRRDGHRSHKPNRLPTYHFAQLLFPRELRIPSTEHKAMVPKTRQLDPEDMLNIIFEERRLRGVWLFGFLLFTSFNRLLAVRVLVRFAEFRKCVPLPVIPIGMLNRLCLGLLGYEQNLKRVEVVRPRLSRVLHSVSGSVMTITSGVPREDLNAGLALEDGRNIKGTTPPLVYRIS
jgi:hypothetical protein